MINIGSGLSIKGSPQYAAYGASKAGVLMLTRTLALELAGYNIRVNAISPGLTKTEMTRDTWSDPENLRQNASIRPLGRLAEPSDVVGAAVFLASDASRYITGHNLLIDGGFYA